MKLGLDQLAQDLKDIVDGDHVFSNLFERVNYADTILPYDLEKEDGGAISYMMPFIRQEVIDFVDEFLQFHRIIVWDYLWPCAFRHCVFWFFNVGFRNLPFFQRFTERRGVDRGKKLRLS